MHESYFHPGTDVQHELKHQAMQKYTQSIRKVVDLDQNHTQNASEVALLTCILFAAIESLQGHIPSSISHIMSGLRLISELDGFYQANLPPAAMPIDLLKCIFVDIGIQIMSITEAPWIGLSWLDKQSSSRPFGTSLSSAEQAQAEMSILVKDMLRLSDKARFHFSRTNMPDMELEIRHNELRTRFLDWSAALEAMLDAKSSISSDEVDKDLAIISLQLSQSVTRGLLETIVRIDEMRFDEYADDFRDAVDFAEKFFAISEPKRDRSQWKPQKFNFAFGILSSLYIICCRCRDHSTRHRALRMMQASDTREGIFDSDLSSRVAEQWIVIEELSAVQYWQNQLRGDDQAIIISDDIPECCRLSRIHAIFPEEKKADMTFISTCGEWRRVVVHWDK